MPMNSWTCKKCGAFFRDKMLSVGHVCGGESAKEQEAVQNAPVPLVDVETEKSAENKYTKEALVEMSKPQLIDIVKSMGIDRIDGKYLSACRVGEIEDAIIKAQEGTDK